MSNSTRISIVLIAIVQALLTFNMESTNKSIKNLESKIMEIETHVNTWLPISSRGQNLYPTREPG